jgi:hypothetical protein
VTRRTFLAGGAARAAAAEGVTREVFIPSPGKGTAVMAYAFYTAASGGGMLSVETRWSRSDTIDISYLRRSRDNGRTWSEPEESPTREQRPNGTLRRHPRAGFADARTGRYIAFWTEGILPTDDPLEGMRQWNIYYRVSSDGARTFGPVEQVLHRGREFNATHPLPGIWTGKNCVMLGDQTSAPIAQRDGTIVLPVQVTALDPEGRPYNPAGGYTWTEACALLGRWRGERLEWEMSNRLALTPRESTRGIMEPTVAELAPRRLLMILRGSNDKNPALPSRKWMSMSNDGGRRWSASAPWTYDDGDPFYSPSSCSQLVAHSSGRLFWLGNITPSNPRGNRPRYPFVIAEVDRRSGLLIRKSVRTIDDRQPGEHEILALSNFYAREDRETRQICLHMTRLFAFPSGWEGDALLYRIRV